MLVSTMSVVPLSPHSALKTSADWRIYNGSILPHEWHRAPIRRVAIVDHLIVSCWIPVSGQALTVRSNGPICSYGSAQVSSSSAPTTDLLRGEN